MRTHILSLVVEVITFEHGRPNVWVHEKNYTSVYDISHLHIDGKIADFSVLYCYVGQKNGKTSLST